MAGYADVLQIGARNMQNYRLLEAVGEPRASRCCLKRGPAPRWTNCCWRPNTSSTRAIPNVMLCERGIRTFETHTRFTLPLASVPYLHDRTHLPVVVDPSHGTGHTALVTRMAAAVGRRRGRRADRRGPSRSRNGLERRLSVVDFQAVRGADGALPEGGRGD